MTVPGSPRHDPLAALRLPEFRRHVTNSFLYTSGIQIQDVLLGYELYLVTRDPLSLGFLGLAAAVPYIAMALFGGHLADRLERLQLMRRSLMVIMGVSLVLVLAAYGPVREALGEQALVAVFYGAAFVLGLVRGIYSPGASSLKAFLVPREIYSNSAAWASSIWQLGMVTGPALAGFLYAGFGLSGALLAVAAMLALGYQQLLGIAPRHPSPHSGEDLWTSLREGLAYVRRTRLIVYSMTLDMVAVFFGSVVAILPVFAEDILQVGPEGLGLLRASPAVGAMLVMFLCAWFPPTVHAWRNLLWAVGGFGVATLVFAVSESMWLSAVMLFATGAFDSVSVVIRQTLLQALPPDHLRGRVVSVNSIFVVSSNELGAFESGVAARLVGVVPSVLFGGAMTLATVGVVWRRSKDLFSARL